MGIFKKAAIMISSRDQWSLLGPDLGKSRSSLEAGSSDCEGLCTKAQYSEVVFSSVLQVIDTMIVGMRVVAWMLMCHMAELV